jgi:hypothetical protein
VDCIHLRGPAPFPAIAHPGWKDVSWGLPAHAWKDDEVRAFVPARFAFCFEETYRSAPGYWRGRKIGLRRMAAMLPASAATLLSGKNGKLTASFAEANDATTCFSLTTTEARRLANDLDRARVKRLKPAYVLMYHLDVQPGVRVEIWFAPMLPNGEAVRSGGG